jgi:Flp pilus assembly protein TadB
MGGALVALSALVAFGAAALAWAHVRRVLRVTSVDAQPIAIALRRLPLEARLAELGRRTEPSSWEHRLAVDLAATTADGERVAVVNDALAAVEAELNAGVGWPAAGLRIVVFGTLLSVALAVLVGRPEVIAFLVVVGALGGVATAEGGRRAKHIASTQRAAIDSLVEAAVGALPVPKVLERRRHGRRKSR